MSRSSLPFSRRILALALLLLPLAAQAQVDIWVTNTAPTGPGSLAAAITALQPGLTSQQRIRFGFNVNNPVGISNVIFMTQPLPDLNGVNVVIDGSDVSPAGVIIDGGGHPIFTVPTTASTTRLQLSNLSLRRGGRIGRGGCVAIEKTTVAASVTNVDFEQCRAYVDATTSARGGALYSASGIDIVDSVFRRNEILSLTGANNNADARGGAIAIEAAAAVSVQRSLFDSNRVYLTNTLPSFCTSGGGGAIAFFVTGNPLVLVSGSSFIDNTTPCRNPTVTYDIPGQGDGGGVLVQGTAVHRFTANFFSGNIGRRGGGVGAEHALNSTLEFTNNTFTGNRGVASGGGIGIINCCTTYLNHNTLIDNTGGPSFGSQLAVAGSNIQSMQYNAMSGATPTCTSFRPGDLTGVGAFNAYSDAGCPLDGQTNIQADLGPLSFAAPAMLGGDTLSMAPSYGSPMIDAGPPNAACAALLDTRGVVRPIDGNQDGVPACDIGAVESSYVPPRPPQILISSFEEGEEDS